MWRWRALACRSHGWLRRARRVTSALLLACLMLGPQSFATEMPALTVEHRLAESGTLDPGGLLSADSITQFLPATDQGLVAALNGRDLWVRISLSSLHSQDMVNGYLIFDGAFPGHMELWSPTGPVTDRLLQTVRGPALPINLTTTESRQWVMRIRDVDYANVNLSLESAGTFQRRATWLSGYVFALVGMCLLAAATMVTNHWKRQRRRRVPMRSYNGLLWPGYLLALSLFSLVHYVGLTGLLAPHGRGALMLSSALITAVVVLLSLIWWASGRVTVDAVSIKRYPMPLVLAVLLAVMGWVASWLGHSLNLFYAALLILAILRLAGWGLKGRQVHSLAPVTAALSLLLWAIIALIQSTPLAFSADARTLLLPMLLAVHGWAIYQSFLNSHVSAPPRQQRTRLLDQSDNSFVLLRKLNHDLRSPIHGVLGITSLLGETALNADQQEYVTTTHNAGIQMLNLADEMRALTRLASGQIQVRPQSVELNEFMHEVVNPFARLASQKSVEVVTDVQSNTPGRIRIDSELLSQVLRIILDNSVKFTEQGVIQVTVRLEGQDRLRIRIDDSGHGVSAVDMPRLFEFQTNQKDLEEGQASMRLGLPVANALIQAMKGQIGVSKSAQQGASFWLSVPFTYDESEEPHSDQITVANLMEQKILIVDDHLACRKVLEDQTRNWGMQPELASSGKEALALLQSHMYFHQPFDWVLIDYRMPEMTGLELVEKIRALEGLKYLRVIVMSGVDLHYVEQTAEDLGVMAVLAKPVNNRQLMRLLSEQS